jgi:oligopeptide transport system substrate-binding protein
VARRNPYFHDRDTVKIDRVEYDVTDDPETGLKRYLTGDLDWVLLPPKEIPRMRAERAAEFHSGPWLSVSFISFNVRKGLFADHPKLREALSLAVDREVIAAKVDPRGQQPAYSFVPPAVTGWAPQPYDWRDRPMAERIARARSLLAEEGYDAAHPLHVTISYSTGEEQRKVLLAVAAMWKSGLGVETTLANQEWRSLIATLEQWDFEISAYGRSNSTNDPGLFLEPFLSTAGENSDTGYANPAFDALMNQGDQAATEGERFVLLEKAEALMLADYPLIPTFFGAINRLVSPRVSGLPDGIGYPQTRYIRISAP